MRLFRSAFRKGQWNKALHYSKTIPRLSALQCCIVTALLLVAVWCSYSAVSSALLQRRLRLQAEAMQSPVAQSPSSAMRHLLATGTAANLTYYDKYCVRLTTVPNKTHIAWETCDFEQSTQNIAGWITLYVVITLIIFVALAIVCDDFFVPSLEAISEKLNLSEDVAGATFMAAGSSAPELFSSVAAVTFDSDAGVGTIAGSAVFNLLVIISLTAAFAGKVLHLDWRPLARDSVWYMVSIAWFIVMVSDTLIQIYEAVVLLVLYIIYIIIMVFNPTLMEKLALLEQKCCCSRVEPASDDAEAAGNSTVSVRSEEPRHFKHDRRNSVMLNLHGSKVSLRDEEKQNGKAGGGKQDAQNGHAGNGTAKRDVSTHAEVFRYKDFHSSVSTVNEDKDSNKDDKEEKEEEEEESPRIRCPGCCPDVRGAPPQRQETMSKVDWLMFVLKWIIFIVAFPFIVLFSWTIPECSREDLKKYFLVSFFVSVLWIAGLSFAMITVVARMGCLIGVDTFVMSLVVLAAGTSIPDLLSSIIVARDGFGDMAISNAIGSNVFDIDLGLGLPFLIRLAINAAEPLDMFSDEERRARCEGTMYVVPHVKFGGILGGLLVVCLAIMIISKFHLGKLVGITFFLMYILFLVYAFVQEFACTYNC